MSTQTTTVISGSFCSVQKGRHLVQILDSPHDRPMFLWFWFVQILPRIGTHTIPTIHKLFAKGLQPLFLLFQWMDPKLSTVASHEMDRLGIRQDLQSKVQIFIVGSLESPRPDRRRRHILCQILGEPIELPTHVHFSTELFTNRPGSSTGIILLEVTSVHSIPSWVIPIAV